MRLLGEFQPRPSSKEVPVLMEKEVCEWLRPTTLGGPIDRRARKEHARLAAKVLDGFEEVIEARAAKALLQTVEAVVGE